MLQQDVGRIGHGNSLWIRPSTPRISNQLKILLSRRGRGGGGILLLLLLLLGTHHRQHRECGTIRQSCIKLSLLLLLQVWRWHLQRVLHAGRHCFERSERKIETPFIIPKTRFLHHLRGEGKDAVVKGTIVPCGMTPDEGDVVEAKVGDEDEEDEVGGGGGADDIGCCCCCCPCCHLPNRGTTSSKGD